MTSDMQIRANRKNATMSVGPRTEGGKARSSQNARTHGLFATQVVGPCEDPEVYEAFYDDLHRELNPKGPLEEQLSEWIIGRLWRLRRVPEIEAAIQAYFHQTNQRDRALDKILAQEEPTFRLDRMVSIRDAKVYEQAKRDRDEAAAALEGPLPHLGAAYRDAEPLLSRLTKIVTAMQGSAYRALKELRAMQAERQLIEIKETNINEKPDAPSPRHRERPSDLS